MKKAMVLVGMLVISAVVFAQNAETDFTVTLADDNAGVVITKYSGTAKNVVIPATIQGAGTGNRTGGFYVFKYYQCDVPRKYYRHKGSRFCWKRPYLNNLTRAYYFRNSIKN